MHHLYSVICFFTWNPEYVTSQLSGTHRKSMHECMYKSYETTLTHLCIFLNRPIVLYLLLFLTLWINRNRKKSKICLSNGSRPQWGRIHCSDTVCGTYWICDVLQSRWFAV